MEGSGGMCPGSDHFCRLEYTGTGQSFGFFCKAHAALYRKRQRKRLFYISLKKCLVSCLKDSEKFTKFYDITFCTLKNL